MPEEVIRGLSWDQLYVYRMVKAMWPGCFHAAGASAGRPHLPQPLANDRLRVSALAVLHYGLTGELLLRLERLITYVVSCYSHLWFHMKVRSS